MKKCSTSDEKTIKVLSFIVMEINLKINALRYRQVLLIIRLYPRKKKKKKIKIKTSTGIILERDAYLPF